VKATACLLTYLAYELYVVFASRHSENCSGIVFNVFVCPCVCQETKNGSGAFL